MRQAAFPWHAALRQLTHFVASAVWQKKESPDWGSHIAEQSS